MIAPTLAAFVVAILPLQLQPPAQPAPTPPTEQWVDPPGAITPDETSLLEQARASINSRGVSDTLTDHRFDRLHPRTEFREAIRDAAKDSTLTISAPDEPGERLVVTGVVKDDSGKPLAGVLLYLYHTSAKGWYAAEAAHVRANSGDHKHARLFGYLKTDAEGNFEIKTIRPGGYPRSDLPQHIHVAADLKGYQPFGTEFLFDDDPRLDTQHRKDAKTSGFLVSPVAKGADGTLKAEYTLVMKHDR